MSRVPPEAPVHQSYSVSGSQDPLAVKESALNDMQSCTIFLKVHIFEHNCCISGLQRCSAMECPAYMSSMYDVGKCVARLNEQHV